MNQGPLAGGARFAILRAVIWHLLSVTLLLASALAVLLLSARRRRLAALARRAAGGVPRYPVVLVHGVCGFDELRLFGWKRRYFVGVGEHLERLEIASLVTIGTPHHGTGRVRASATP